jgi:putative transposase
MYEVVEMPKKAREKSPESIYHIMCHSISEVELFRNNEDKIYYLELLRRYKNKYKCSIYAYCLMDNHVHIHFDPKGFDVSKFMQSLNSAYVWYYNHTYKRRGPLFQDRFKSRILDTEKYNLAVSAYIHNNPKDIAGYEGKECLYPYSSYGIYLGLRKDIHDILDQNFIKSLFELKNNEVFIKRYTEFVNHHKEMGTIKKIVEALPKMDENEYRCGRSIILRDYKPSKIISYISDRLLDSDKRSLMFKYRRLSMNYRAPCTYVIRVLCNVSYREICENIHNITVSNCSSLCARGYDLINKNNDYSEIFNELMNMSKI